MDYIADECAINHRTTGSSLQNTMKKDLRRGLKSIKKGVRQGEKTILRGFRTASKLLDISSPATHSTSASESDITTPSEFDINRDVEIDQEEAHPTPSSSFQCDISDNQALDSLSSAERSAVESSEELHLFSPVTVAEKNSSQANDSRVGEDTGIVPEKEIEILGRDSEKQLDQLPRGNSQRADKEKGSFSSIGATISSSRVPGNLKPGSAEYFEKWTQNLEASLVVPYLDLELWSETLHGYQKSKDALDGAQKDLDLAQKDAEPDQPIIDLLTKAVDEARQVLNNTFENTQAIAESMIGTPEFQTFLQPDGLGEDDWITWRVLKSVAPKQWAQWCQETNGQSMLGFILGMLQSPDFLREIIQEGDGPRGNNYYNFLKLWQKLRPQESPDFLRGIIQEGDGPCGNNYYNFLKLWQELCPQEHQVLRRLAMAIALEFAADDYIIFGTKDRIDPIQRYIHYEQAYLAGELDPSFGTFGVWDLRMVVNSDASNDQLSSGRSCLINYRPDLILWDNEKWRYNFIVKSDVSCNAPDWYKQPKSYDQILSGGGKSGPRAWYGRFICKAFGIPTWGCRQTGLASMSRWTPNGWVVCLGANWPHCFWEGRTGVNFKLESDARRACRSSAEYHQLVQRLQWIVIKNGENDTSVRERIEPSPLCPWSSLAMLQAKIISSRSNPTILGDATNRSRCPPAGDEKVILSKIQRMKNQGTLVSGSAWFDSDTSTLTIPADCCSRPQQNTNKVKFHPSFSGGRQIFLQGDGVIEYTLGAPFPKPDGTKQYKLSLCVCSVHRAEADMRVTVFQQGGAIREITVALPYTMGEWQFTEPVMIEFACGSYPMLSFQRSFHGFGISLKEVKVTLA